MTPIKRPLAAAGAAALLALSLTACGGSAPADASEADFCKAFTDQSDLQEIGDDDHDAQADALHDYADGLEEVGTPENIPDDARKGFEAIIKVYNDISSGDLEEAAKEDSDIEAEFEKKYEDDKEDVEAFYTYATTTCAGDLGSEVPSQSTEVPSLDPSDIPSELEDLPTDPEDLASLQSELAELTEGAQ